MTHLEQAISNSEIANRTGSARLIHEYAEALAHAARVEMLTQKQERVESKPVQITSEKIKEILT